MQNLKISNYNNKKEKIFVKTLVVIIGLLLYILISHNNLPNPIVKGNKFDLALDWILENATYYLSQNLIYRNFTVIYAGLWLDTCYIIFLTLYVYRGTGFRELIAFVLFYGVRAIFIAIFDFDYPKLNFIEEPGFFSIVSPHGRSADFFYSGHTGFSLLCSLFVLNYKHYYLFILGLFVTFLQAFERMITRSHYVIDIYFGLIAAHYFYMISPKFGKFLNKLIPILND
jgi:hypothetical protein